MILSHRAPSSLNMSSYRAIWTHFRPISMIFEQINMHAPLAMFLVGRHNLQTPHPSCMLLAQPAACTGLPCVVHSFWLCLIFCARYSFNSILEAPNLWVRCSRLFAPNLWVRCSRLLLFFPEKRVPILLEAPNLWVCCSRLFFSQIKGPHISGSP